MRHRKRTFDFDYHGYEIASDNGGCIVPALEKGERLFQYALQRFNGSMVYSGFSVTIPISHRDSNFITQFCNSWTKNIDFKEEKVVYFRSAVGYNGQLTGYRFCYFTPDETSSDLCFRAALSTWSRLLGHSNTLSFVAQRQLFGIGRDQSSLSINSSNFNEMRQKILYSMSFLAQSSPILGLPPGMKSFSGSTMKKTVIL